jgi:trigger factor
LSFEIKPSIDLPEYHGLKGTQNKVEVTEAQVDRVISQIQHNYSELELSNEDRQPVEGDVPVIEFAAFENGEPLENIKSESFELPLGEGQSLQDFEAIVKKLRPGERTTEPITFPEDFINQELAGKTVEMQVELKVIKTRKLPEVDDELAEKMGASSVQEMRERITENLKNYRQNMEKSVTQKQLIDQLLSQVEVSLPESLVDSQLQYLINSKRDQLERQGKSLDSLGSEEELREKFRPEAEENVKSQLVLLEVANREDLSVSNQEIEQQIMRMAINNGQDPQELKKYYEENNLMFALRDSLLADKAMETIYEHAQIEEVEPGSEQGPEAEEPARDEASSGEAAEAEGE